MDENGAELRVFLAERDAPCARCGYNLRGLTGGACPECGWEVSLEKLREVEEHRAWRESRMPRGPIASAGLIGAILGLGWPVVWMMLGLRAKQIEFWHFVVLVVLTVVQVGMVVVYLRGEGKWPRRKKVGLATLAWCWGPVVLGGMVVWGMIRR